MEGSWFNDVQFSPIDEDILDQCGDDEIRTATNGFCELCKYWSMSSPRRLRVEGEMRFHVVLGESPRRLSVVHWCHKHYLTKSHPYKHVCAVHHVLSHRLFLHGDAADLDLVGIASSCAACNCLLPPIGGEALLLLGQNVWG